MTAKTFWASIAFMLISLAYAEYDVAKYCELVKAGTKLPSTESCDTYYTCRGYNQVAKETCSPGLEFSRNNQGCVPKSESYCIYGLSNPCRNRNKQFAANRKGCNWYNWCENGEVAGEGTCNFGEVFYAANGSCVNGACNNGMQDADDLNLCDIMQDNQFFGDFTDCSRWRKCNGLNLESGSCEYPLVYNADTQQCLANDGNMCRRTNNVVGDQPSGPPKVACTSPDQIAADMNQCYTYYKCTQVLNAPGNVYEWVQHKCVNQFYDVVNKQCTSSTLARAYPGCDRCQLKSGSLYWANAVDNKCSSYLTCSNGKMLGKASRSCLDGHYYDEDMQACIPSNVRFDDYIRQHGACQNFNCNADRVCSTPEENDVTAKPEVTDAPNTTVTAKPTDKPEDAGKP